MSQSGVIGAALLAGFVLFLAARDRLKVYTGVLWGDTSAPLPSAQTQAAAKDSGGDGILPDLGGFGDIAKGAAGVLLPFKLPF